MTEEDLLELAEDIYREIDLANGRLIAATAALARARETMELAVNDLNRISSR